MPIPNENGGKRKKVFESDDHGAHENLLPQVSPGQEQTPTMAARSRMLAASKGRRYLEKRSLPRMPWSRILQLVSLALAAVRIKSGMSVRLNCLNPEGALS